MSDYWALDSTDAFSSLHKKRKGPASADLTPSAQPPPASASHHRRRVSWGLAGSFDSPDPSVGSSGGSPFEGYGTPEVRRRVRDIQRADVGGRGSGLTRKRGDRDGTKEGEEDILREEIKGIKKDYKRPVGPPTLGSKGTAVKEQEAGGEALPKDRPGRKSKNFGPMIGPCAPTLNLAHPKLEQAFKGGDSEDGKGEKGDGREGESMVLHHRIVPPVPPVMSPPTSLVTDVESRLRVMFPWVSPESMKATAKATAVKIVEKGRFQEWDETIIKGVGTGGGEEEAGMRCVTTHHPARRPSHPSQTGC